MGQLTFPTNTWVIIFFPEKWGKTRLRVWLVCLLKISQAVIKLKTDTFTVPKKGYKLSSFSIKALSFIHFYSHIMQVSHCVTSSLSHN